MMKDYVYIADDVYSWLPAKVLSRPSSDQLEKHVVKVQVIKPTNWNETTVQPLVMKNNTIEGDQMIRSIDLRKYAGHVLPLQNVTRIDDNEVTSVVKADMADLPNLHEAAVLYNVKELYCDPSSCVPYTRVGDIIIALNPFVWMKELYSQKKQTFYADALIWSVPPPIAKRPSMELMTNAESTLHSTATSEEQTTAAASFFTRSKYYSPHIYETSSLAYRSMIYHRKNQTILVSGESGAGKTETVKLCMSHLAYIQSMMPLSDHDKASAATMKNNIVERVLESNPIFEAFGCATTKLNNNSSRYGKFTSLVFQVSTSLHRDDDEQSSLNSKSSKSDDSCNYRHEQKIQISNNHIPRGILVGSTTETYLLEKSRVVTHGSQERTYHIFYQLLAAPEELKVNIWDGLANTTNDSFKYVATENTVSTCAIKNVDSLTNGQQNQRQQSLEDAAEFLRTVKDLALFDITGDGYLELMRALCIVMQLGNLSFECGDSSNDSSKISTSSIGELNKLSSLMGCTSEKLEIALTTRIMEARGESFSAHLPPGVAKDGGDALAKEIYARIFYFLVEAINKATGYTPPQDQRSHQLLATISILDMFGFESFDVNRFEQLCINYANEKLQQKYVMDNFRLVQTEYMEEGIELFDLSIVDNSHILDVIEGPMGVIDTLNDECIRPNGSDASFVYKIKAYHNNASNNNSDMNNLVIVSEKLHLPVQFGVKHFIGTVTYDATKIVEVNNDLLPKDLIDLCVNYCTNKIVNNEFKKLQQSRLKAEHSKVTNRRLTKSNTKTVAGKFRSQLATLMMKIVESKTRYIRCIRPNKEMQPGLLDHSCTTRQLSSAGLVTAIAISRETFPDRLEYKNVTERFSILIAPHESSITANGTALEKNIRIWAEQILEELFIGFGVDALGTIKRPYACGKTRIYFRTGALEHLEVKREHYYGVTATIIQRYFRCKLSKLNYACKKIFCSLLQATFRSSYARGIYREKLYSIVIIQSGVRSWSGKKYYSQSRLHNASVKIQTAYRCQVCKGINQARVASLQLQRWFRGLKSRVRFNSALAKCVEDARMNHEIKSLQRKFSILSRREGSHELSLLAEDCTKLLDYAVTEMFTLRRLNADVCQESSELKERNQRLVEFHQSLEAAVALSNRRVVQMGRSNSALVAEVALQTKKSAALEKQLKALQLKHEGELKSLQEKCDSENASRELENDQLLKSTEKLVQHHKREMRRAEKERRKADEKSANDTAQLQKELRETQEAHHDYLNKLMDVVENAHLAREAEEARLTDEFSARLEAKDREISKLRGELSTLKKAAHRNKAYI